jgi:aryl sulfotransferase
MATAQQNFVFNSERWNGFELRDDDIIISTPPKCGTTWTQMIVALLLFDTADLPAPLAHLSPWLDMNTRPLADVRAELEGQTHRRFIKSHLPMEALPYDERVTYITCGRDPRDVAMSWAHHLANIDMDVFIPQRIAAVGADDLEALGAPVFPPEDPTEAFWYWIEEVNPTMGSLVDTVHHVGSFWHRRDEPNIIALHYSDLQRDLSGEMARVATGLGLERSAERIAELAPYATFDAMREHADRVAPNSDQGFWKSTTDFFHKGTSGQWREMMRDDELPRYEKRIAALTTPDFAHWLHHGSVG